MGLMVVVNSKMKFTVGGKGSQPLAMERGCLSCAKEKRGIRADLCGLHTVQILIWKRLTVSSQIIFQIVIVMEYTKYWIPVIELYPYSINSLSDELSSI